MDTFFAKNRLSAYLDGALPESEASDVADAIARDPELRAEYESLRSALSTLRQHGPVSAPEGFKARVMAQVDRETASGGIVVQLRRRLTRVPLEAVAVAAAALIVVFTTTSQMSSPPESTPAPATPAVAEAPAAAPTGTDQPAPATAPPEADAQVAAAPAKPSEPAPSLKTMPAPATPKYTSAKSAPTKSGSGAKSPETAYVPEWESERSGSETAFGTIEGLSLSASDPKVLEKLYMLTERAGGRMLDEASQSLRPYRLTEDDPVARVMLMVPVDRAATLRAQLEGLGATAGRPPSGGPTLTAGYSGFYVEARLLP